MADTITPDELAAVLTATAAKYTEEFKETLDEELEKIGKEAVAEVKKLSPVYTGKSKKLKKGKYRSGWRYEIQKNRGAIKVTVHNKHYQLTHLLENGTLNHDGTQRSRSIPHISIANRHAEEKVDKLLEEL